MKPMSQEHKQSKSRRIVLLNKQTGEPELLALNITDASHYLNINHAYVNFLCNKDKAHKVCDKVKQSLPYDIMYADEWEVDHYTALPYGGVPLDITLEDINN